MPAAKSEQPAADKARKWLFTTLESLCPPERKGNGLRAIPESSGFDPVPLAFEGLMP
jgi:hypothetical protein